MKIRWIRGNDRINFNRPHNFFILGIRGSGKSSFLENLACHYLEKGHTVLDLFAAKDAESLSWLRSSYAKTKKILLLKGENVVVDCSYDVKNASKLSLKDFNKYEIIISSNPFYSSIDDEFMNAALIMNKVYKRLSWKRLIYCLVREASNLFYSRLKLREDQTLAKAEAIYLCREARHVGMSLGLDSIRWYSIDVDLRSISDFLVLKSQGISGLSKDLRWVYRYFLPRSIQNMKPNTFMILSRKGSLGYGIFPEVSWHKQEHENILKKLRITVEYKEPVRKGLYRGSYKTIGDEEHIAIMRLYIQDELSMNKISEKLGRSAKSVFGHIKRHNASVERSGFCPICQRGNSPLEKVIAKRQ